MTTLHDICGSNNNSSKNSLKKKISSSSSAAYYGRTKQHQHEDPDLDSNDGTAATEATTLNSDTSLSSRTSRKKMGEYDDSYGNGLRSPYDDDDPEDFPGASFDKNLDEAFGPSGGGGGERTRGVRREKSGSRRRSPQRRRDRSPTGDSQESGGRQVPMRGLARQRSQRRANIAAAVSMIGNDDPPQSRAGERERKPRRNRTHEDRLNAAIMGDPMGVYNQDIDLGYDDEASGGGNDRHKPRGNRHQRGGSDEHYDDADYDDYDIDIEDSDHGDGDRRHGPRGERSSRRPGPRRGEEEPYYDDDDRRSRFKGKGAAKSFDDSSTLRARGRRRASMMGAAGAGGSGSVDPHHRHHPADDDVSSAGIRPRRPRRASTIGGGEIGPPGDRGAAVGRPEPASRGVRESRSGGRMMRGGARRPSAFGTAGDGGESASDFNYGNDDDGDEGTMESQKAQQWQENRANKQKAMLERLKKREEEPEPAEEDEGSLEGDLAEPEPEEPPDDKDKDKKGRSRRTSIGITKAFGMSASNFAGLDKEVEKEKKKEEKRLKKEEKEREKAVRKLPGRSKSSDGGIVPPGAGGRARATDRDRRRPGTMLDRIGADQGIPPRTRSGPGGGYSERGGR